MMAFNFRVPVAAGARFVGALHIKVTAMHVFPAAIFSQSALVRVPCSPSHHQWLRFPSILHIWSPASCNRIAETGQYSIRMMRSSMSLTVQEVLVSAR
jgi:hypothetical protein